LSSRGTGLLLGIDSSGRVPSIALLALDRDPWLATCEPPVRGEGLADLLRLGLKDLSAAVADISAVGVSTGPGSWTGVRIGLALAAGLVLPHKLPVTGMSSLRLQLACCDQPAEGDRSPILATLDAGSGNIYVAAWSSDGGEQLLDYKRCTAEELLVDLRALPAGLRVAGTAAQAVIGACSEAGLPMPGLASEVLDPAVALAKAAGTELDSTSSKTGDRVVPEQALPTYIGPTGARPNKNRVATGWSAGSGQQEKAPGVEERDS